MIVFSIVILIVIPAIIGFVAKRHHATNYWRYCPAASFINAFLYFPNAFSDVPSYRGQGASFYSALMCNLVLASVFYWGAMGVLYLSRWHSDEEKPAAKLPEEKAVVDKKAEPPTAP